MKNIFILSAFFFFLQQGFTQKKEKVEEMPWQITNVVNLSDSTGAGSIKFSPKEKKSGVIFIDQEGNASKEVTFPGNAIGIGKWNGEIVAFYRDGWNEKNADKEIHAVLIDPRKGVLLSDKLIYQNPGDTHLDISILKDNDGNLKSLLVRVSARSGNRESETNKAMNELGMTTTLTALFFSDKPEPVARQLSSTAVGGLYLSAFANKKGDLTVISELNGQLVAEKFGQDGQLQKKLTTPIDFVEKNPGTYQRPTAGCFDPASDDILAYDIYHIDQKGHKMLLSLFLFDFGKGLVQVGETNTLNKDFIKELNLKDKTEVKPGDFNRIDGLQPDAVLYIGDRLIVCNEIRYSRYPAEKDAHLRYDADGAIASVYDRQLHLIHRFFLGKTYEAFIDGGRGFSYSIRNGKLLLLGNIDEGHLYNNVCFIIDPAKLTMEKKMPAWGNIEKGYPVMPESVLWFNKGIVKNHSAESHMFGWHVKSFLIKAAYE